MVTYAQTYKLTNGIELETSEIYTDISGNLTYNEGATTDHWWKGADGLIDT